MKNKVREEIISGLAQGCCFFEIGNYFFEVCPTSVTVTHESGENMVFSLKNVETRKHKYNRGIEGHYWKQHAIWSTENGDLNYTKYGDGSKGDAVPNTKTKIETVMCFLDDQSVFERFDRFSNKGAQEFMHEYGYDCDCDSDSNIFDVKESFENTDRCITIPVSDYEEGISEWHGNGIGSGDLELLAMGLSPEDEFPEEFDASTAWELMRRGASIEDLVQHSVYSLADGKAQKADGVPLNMEEFLSLKTLFKSRGWPDL